MNVWSYLMLFFAVIIGGYVGNILSREKNDTLLTLIMPISGAFLLGILTTHILPHVFIDAPDPHTAGIWLILGYLVQLILDSFSKGVEHGHVHKIASNFGLVGFSLLAGLSLHAFLEGIPITFFSDEHTGHDHGAMGKYAFLAGIIFHKIPAAITLAVVFNLSGIPKKYLIGSILFFALMSPLGMALGEFFVVSIKVQNILGAVVAGSFLHICTVILFELDSNHHFSWVKFIGILLGLGLSLLTMI